MDRLLVFIQFKDALFEKKALLTLEETNVITESSEHARRAFWINFYVAGFAVWLGTRRLQNALRLPFAGEILPFGMILQLSLTTTSATYGGLFGIGRSFGSSFEHILNQEGSQIQIELGNVLVSFVEKYPGASESIMKQHISKHFYLEKVFDDLSTDRPKQVWRYRNFFGDDASSSQKTTQSGSYSENTNESSTDDDTMADPFDWIVHTPVPERVEDNEKAASCTMSHRRHKRSHKRSHRRLISRREASTDMRHALADKGMASI
ncbi:hypothetical protein ACET3Z_032574 [Daucus carota]